MCRDGKYQVLLILSIFQEIEECLSVSSADTISRTLFYRSRPNGLTTCEEFGGQSNLFGWTRSEKVPKSQGSDAALLPCASVGLFEYRPKTTPRPKNGATSKRASSIGRRIRPQSIPKRQKTLAGDEDTSKACRPQKAAKLHSRPGARFSNRRLRRKVVHLPLLRGGGCV